MLNPRAIFLISEFLLVNKLLESNLVRVSAHKKLVLASFSLPLLEVLFGAKFLLSNKL
jgi:hypothetical protein